MKNIEEVRRIYSSTGTENIFHSYNSSLSSLNKKNNDECYCKNVLPHVNISTNDIKEGIDFILYHLSDPLFPRCIMTKRLGCQIEVANKEAALKEFELSNWLDCRINAYPVFKEYKGINFTAPSFVFIDLDLSNFKDLNALNRALANTIKNISALNSKSRPTVLWTGNGYHIYCPLSAFVLEKEQIFVNFIDPLDADLSTKFMRYAEQYFTNGKQDLNHKPSINNCLLRIPGTYNSKNGERIKIVQEWNSYRTPIQYMLRGFRRYLIQERINKRLEQQEHCNQSQRLLESNNGSVTAVGWIEDLLKIPIRDHRKYCIWRILAPYLVNSRKVSEGEAVETIMSWLNECNKIEKLSFYSRSRVKDDVRRARRGGYYPIGYNNLHKENPELYELIKEAQK